MRTKSQTWYSIYIHFMNCGQRIIPEPPCKNGPNDVLVVIITIFMLTMKIKKHTHYNDMSRLNINKIDEIDVKI